MGKLSLCHLLEDASITMAQSGGLPPNLVQLVGRTVSHSETCCTKCTFCSTGTLPAQCG